MSLADPDPHELLGLAVEAAREAGALLRARFDAGPEHDVSAKTTPTDLVSEADRAAQRAIRSVIGTLRPEDGFLGEEEETDVAGSSGLRWIVDPLDGTINFLFGVPQWCVSIAVRDAEATLAGVIHDPVAGETFTILRGERPQRNGATLTGSSRQDVALAESLVATGFAYDAAVRAAQGRVIAELLPKVRDIRRFGAAALDLAWTAAGRYDAYFERGLKAWDAAAGVALCEGVGLEVHELPARGELPVGTLVAPSSLAPQLLELVR